MKSNNRLLCGIMLGIMSVCLAGCSYIDGLFDKAVSEYSYDKAPIESSLEVHDRDSLYDKPIQNDVLYLTVGRGAAPTDPTWTQLNSTELAWFEENDLEPYECDALVQFGDEESPTSGCFGYEDMASNARIRLSGARASTRPQKSYKIKINAGSGNVSGMKTFILSKNYTDPFRFTNKLCFDLMTETDDILSVRTRFVHLYVRDESEGEDNLFADYGLYTLTETINRKYLSNRELDSSGELYKAEDFDFGRHADIIKQPTDSSYDEKTMEKVLEAKGSNDYTKLINMLDALNSGNYAVEDIVDTYFDEDNLYTWLAFNILMDNKDTDTENFYLYSPTGSDKFYILPWDNDAALRGDYELLRDEYYSPGWEKGIYLYTESELFSRIMKSRNCINKLSEYVTKLHESVLSADNVAAHARELSGDVLPYLYSLPDKTYARVTQGDYEKLIGLLPEQMDNNFYAYYDSLETPWPFHIFEPDMKDGSLIITWEESSVLEGDVTYKVEISDSWDFKKILKSEENLKTTEYNAGYCPEGQYFVKVTAISDTGMEQVAYEFFNTEQKTTVQGVLCFYIMDDGTVIQSTF